MHGSQTCYTAAAKQQSQLGCDLGSKARRQTAVLVVAFATGPPAMNPPADEYNALCLSAIWLLQETVLATVMFTDRQSLELFAKLGLHVLPNWLGIRQGVQGGRQRVVQHFSAWYSSTTTLPGTKQKRLLSCSKHLHFALLQLKYPVA
jgi:hypothetical protein